MLALDGLAEGMAASGALSTPFNAPRYAFPIGGRAAVIITTSLIDSLRSPGLQLTCDSRWYSPLAGAARAHVATTYSLVNSCGVRPDAALSLGFALRLSTSRSARREPGLGSREFVLKKAAYLARQFAKITFPAAQQPDVHQ